MKKALLVLFELLCCGASFFLIQIPFADSPIILWLVRATLIFCATLGTLDALWDGRFLDKFLRFFPEKNNNVLGIPEFFVKCALVLSAAGLIVGLLDPTKSGLIILAAIGIFFAALAKALLALFGD